MSHVVATVSNIASVIGAVFGDTLGAGIKGLRLWLGDQIGFVEAMLRELIFMPTSTDMVNIVYGYEFSDVVEIYRAVAGVGLRTQAWLGGTIGENIVNSVITALAHTALGETVGDYARLIFNVYRGIRPTWAFNLIFMGNVLEYIDSDTLALLMAMGGEHIFGTITYIQQALGWLFEMEQFDVIRAIDRAVDDFEDALTWDLDMAIRETRWWFSEGLRVYHRAFTRLLSIVDRIIERAMARLWELRVQVTTVYKWYTLNLVKVERLLKMMAQVEAEVDMTIENVNKAIGFVYDAIGALNFEKELDALESAIDTVYFNIAEAQIKKLSAIGRAPYKDVIDKINDAITKLVAYRTRVSQTWSRGVAAPITMATYPTPISSISIEEMYGEDVT